MNATVSDARRRPWKPCDLSHDGFCQAVGRNELGPKAVHGSQVGLARMVDESHPRQVKADGRPPLAGQRALPTFLDLAHQGACQRPFELKGHRFRVVVDGDPQHCSP
jgi:archaeosine-15-forming tRNA-guanine transglycosylase